MFRSYRVGSLVGIPFKLDISFFLLLPVVTWLLGLQVGTIATVLNELFGTSIDSGVLTGGVRPFVLGFLVTILLFACVTLHELGHSVAGIYYDYEIESITLWVLGGIARPAERPRNWAHELVIAIAGPAVNILIVAGCALLFLVLPPADVFVFLLLYLALLNAGLAVFNMLPAFPLDGGRVLRALLASRQEYVDATQTATGVGKIFAVFLGVFGLLQPSFILVGIAIFVYFGANSEARQVRFDSALEGVTARQMMTPAEELLSIEANLPLVEFRQLDLESNQFGYPVLNRGEFRGIVTSAEIQHAPHSTAADAVTPPRELVTIRPEEEPLEALRSVETAELDLIPVVDHGRLAGIITTEDLFRTVSGGTDTPSIEQSGESEHAEYIESTVEETDWEPKR